MTLCRLFSLVAVFLLLQSAHAVTLVSMASDEGLERLHRSKYRVDFAKLSNHYRNQTDRMFCGPVAGAIVLNALRYNTDKAPLVTLPEAFLRQMPVDDKGVKFDPRLHVYTPENFLNEKALKIKTLSRIYAEPIDDKRSPGISLDDYGQMFDQAHGLLVIKVHVGTPETASNKENAKPLPAEEYQHAHTAIKKNLAQTGNFVLANYSRKSLGQPGTGHISPVAAYDEKSDSFLILDVNPYGGPWVWVEAKDFIAAMNTTDSDYNRGFLLLSEK